MKYKYNEKGITIIVLIITIIVLLIILAVTYSGIRSTKLTEEAEKTLDDFHDKVEEQQNEIDYIENILNLE